MCRCKINLLRALNSSLSSNDSSSLIVTISLFPLVFSVQHRSIGVASSGALTPDTGAKIFGGKARVESLEKIWCLFKEVPLPG